MIDSILENPVVMIIFCLICVVGLSIMASKHDDKRCAQIMSYARTARDSMDAHIACEKIKDDTEMAMIAAGAAGAIAGSRR